MSSSSFACSASSAARTTVQRWERRAGTRAGVRRAAEAPSLRACSETSACGVVSGEARRRRERRRNEKRARGSGRVERREGESRAPGARGGDARGRGGDGQGSHEESACDAWKTDEIPASPARRITSSGGSPARRSEKLPPSKSVAPRWRRKFKTAHHTIKDKIFLGPDDEAGQPSAPLGADLSRGWPPPRGDYHPRGSDRIRAARAESESRLRLASRPRRPRRDFGRDPSPDANPSPDARALMVHV